MLGWADSKKVPHVGFHALRSWRSEARMEAKAHKTFRHSQAVIFMPDKICRSKKIDDFTPKIVEI